MIGFRCSSCMLSASMSLRASHSEATPASLEELPEGRAGSDVCPRAAATKKPANQTNANFMVTLPKASVAQFGRARSKARSERGSVGRTGSGSAGGRRGGGRTRWLVFSDTRRSAARNASDASMTRWTDGDPIRRVTQSTDDAMEQFVLIDEALGQRLIPVNVQGFAGVHDLGGTGLQRVANFHRAFFHGNDGGLVVVVDADVKNGAANGNHRGGRHDAIRIGLAAQALNMNFDAADKKIQKIAQTAWIFPENNVGAGINLESATVGGLKFSVAVRTGQDHLLGLHQVADVQRPGLGITENRNLAGHRQYFSRSRGRYGEQLGRAELRGS